MRQLVFALQFRGSAGAVAGSDGKRLWARTAASSQTLRTTLDGAAIRASVEPGPGSASFESEVEMLDGGTFRESGTIIYGGAGHVRFRTVGRGVLGASGIDGLQRGAVIWEIEGGDGEFAGASGLITSNFSVDAAGEVVDSQFAQLFLRA
jgi:hypothetical protein